MSETPATVAPTADVDPLATVGDRTRVWHLAQVREGARIGADCVIGRGAYIGPGVVVGDRCKIQNGALIYEPALLEDGAFVGPAVVFTNDFYPRAVNPDGSPKSPDDWHPQGVTVRTGASVGARSVCIAPVTIGRWALVAAGSVVTQDVADFALVAGAPARRIRWVGRAGEPLAPADTVTTAPSGSPAQPPGASLWTCPRTGELYVESSGVLRPDDER